MLWAKAPMNSDPMCLGTGLANFQTTKQQIEEGAGSVLVASCWTMKSSIPTCKIIGFGNNQILGFGKVTKQQFPEIGIGLITTPPTDRRPIGRQRLEFSRVHVRGVSVTMRACICHLPRGVVFQQRPCSQHLCLHLSYPTRPLCPQTP